MTVPTTASALTSDHSFMMFNQECFVVRTTPNGVGQTIICFMTNIDRDDRIGTLVLDNDFPMDVTATRV